MSITCVSNYETNTMPNIFFSSKCLNINHYNISLRLSLNLGVMIKKYFALTNRERNGFFAMLMICVAITFADHYVRTNFGPPLLDLSELEDSVNAFYASKYEDEKIADDLNTQSSEQLYSNEKAYVKKDKPLAIVELNGASKEKLMTVQGVGAFYADKIIEIRKKYGGLSSLQPLLEMYGMDQKRLDIMAKQLTIDTSKIWEKIPINSADTLLLTQIPTIRNYDARRIVNYRERLGGFYSTSQLLEVYGISEEKYKDIMLRITLDTIALRQLDINNAPFKVVMKHPYINGYENTKAIFRCLEYGAYENWEDFCKTSNLKIENLEGLRHYLKFEALEPKPDETKEND